ncbi:hypothetical protein EJ03DRAFT_333599 [Teratosphaeria nubilosa]|uniref:Uncharacterized protein n=1 Tax=Teratosphaeria nubilosa TaxID=161662 RepID=A0A6G1LL89_9PEZI|nr:hypothetical protein EJ03DRAFT_333599 [Teratosphaeria nubilosa]
MGLVPQVSMEVGTYLEGTPPFEEYEDIIGTNVLRFQAFNYYVGGAAEATGVLFLQNDGPYTRQCRASRRAKRSRFLVFPGAFAFVSRGAKALKAVAAVQAWMSYVRSEAAFFNRHQQHPRRVKSVDLTDLSTLLDETDPGVYSSILLARELLVGELCQSSLLMFSLAFGGGRITSTEHMPAVIDPSRIQAIVLCCVAKAILLMRLKR